MDVNTLVSDSLEYYDANNEKYESFFKRVKNVKFEAAKSDLDYYEIIFFDEHGIALGKSRYENIGVYSQKGRVWTWAWSISAFAKKTTAIIRKVLNYGFDIDSDKIFLKNELITSRFKISDKTQLDIHIAIASYLSKQPAIFIIKKPPNTSYNEIVLDIEFDKNDDNVYYILYILDPDNFAISNTDYNP